MNKTQPTDDSVAAFLDSLTHAKRQADSRRLAALMQELSGFPPILWGTIIGFGSFHYAYASGREGDTMIIGFAPRANALVLYGMVDCEQNRVLVEELGPHTAGKGCIYIKDLDAVNMDVLAAMIRSAVAART